MRLIDADTLTQKAQEIIGTEASYKAYAIMDAILTAPTVDVATGINVPDKWISVKGRLPEDEGDVLVYGVSPRGRKTFAIMNYLAFEADRPRWALDGIWTVLYWMPIEPPKEGEAGCG